MGFTTELVAQQVGDFDWSLAEPLVYKGHTHTFVAGAGFETDFASVPGLFQWLLPRSGRYTKAAVLHDSLWRKKSSISVSRSDADGIFRRAMSELGVPFLRRWVMWAAVRWDSLWKSRFSDGRGDLPRVVLVTVAPGLFVIAGGLVVLVFLIGFWVFEELAAAALWMLRRSDRVRARIKPVNRPKLLWRS